ncbi:Cna B-type domain-containing protein [Enterococcus sp. DIV0800]|uniref:Cna B-type domain-containing protein n=1 Tax=unclassified Enterococcus TaxID=2608891 RepID=UPI003D2FE083
MPKIKLFVVVTLMFSFLAGVFLPTTQVQSETIKKTIIDEDYLNMSYEFEEKAEDSQLLLKFKRRAEDKKVQQRLKMKLTDGKNESIEYPESASLKEDGGWLIEKEFSAEQEKQITVKLSKSIKELNLYVQMDQKSISDESDGKIEENVLNQEKPYVLKLKDEKQATNSSSKKAETKKEKTTESSQGLIGPKKEKATQSNGPANAPMNSTSRMFEPIYQTKVPQYTTGNDVYPISAWSPQGQPNIKNHQGSPAGSNNWDGETSWNVAGDNHTKSYMKYGEDPSDPNLSLRKYAQKTNEEDEFKIKLNVKGNTTHKPGVDIVFLLDNTGSMKAGGSPKKSQAVTALNKIIDKLKEDANPSSNGIRVGAHIFASYEKVIEDDWNWTRSKTRHKLSANPTDWEKIKTDYADLTPVGDTFTQRGLQEAEDIFDDPSTSLGENRHKLLFVLTDGAPTTSWVPLSAEPNNTMFYDKTLVTNFDSGSKPNYKNGSTLNGGYNKTKFTSGSLYVNGSPINSHITTTNSTAFRLKNNGIEIHAVAVQITSPSDGSDHNVNELLEGLYMMASRKANAGGYGQNDHFFHHSVNASSLTEDIKAWYQTVIRTVDKGIICDPLGDMVELVRGPTWTQVGGAPIAYEDQPSAYPTNGNRQIEVCNINLTGNQEIEVEYTVRLKSNAVSNRWYPTNGRTTLNPTPERTTDLLDFGVPSVRKQQTIDELSIPVRKIWDDNNDTSKRPSSITVKLQRSTNGGSWTDVGTKQLSNSNSWTQTFTGLEKGAGIQYRVTEPTQTTGYLPATVSPATINSATPFTGEVQVTNKIKGAAFEIPVEKIWNDNNQTNKRPPKITVKLQRSNGVDWDDIATKDLVASKQWKDSFTVENYEAISYRIVEVGQVTGYEAPQYNQEWFNSDWNPMPAGGIKITNTISAADFVIPVEKVWEDENNQFGTRPTSVTAQLQRLGGTGWENVEEKVLDAGNNWKDNFSAVDGDDSIVYRVQELNRTPGYKAPTMNIAAFTKPELAFVEGTVKITNTLIKTNYQFVKVFDDGATPFSGSDLPKFSVKRKSNGTVLAENLTPNASGEVKIENLTFGTFEVEETHVPQGFQKMSNFDIVVTENGAGTALVVKVNNSTDSYKAKNKLKDFSMTVLKVDEDGSTPLGGATFKLSGPDGYEQTESSEFMFFNNLRPGQYTLEETQAPQDYSKITTPISITIGLDGTVTIPTHPNATWYGGVDEYGNDITLTVTNKKDREGALPATGDTGIKAFMLVAASLAVAGMITGGVFVIRSRREG